MKLYSGKGYGPVWCLEKKTSVINAMRALWAAAAFLAVLQCSEAFAETSIVSVQWQSFTGGFDGRRLTEPVSSLMSELLELRGGCDVLSIASVPCVRTVLACTHAACLSLEIPHDGLV